MTSLRKYGHIFSKVKNETYVKFKHWKEMVKTQKEKKVKVLRIDNVLEFCSKGFNTYYPVNGIQRHRTIVENPQQNRLMERMNKNILEKVRCMLSNASLSKGF